VYLYIEPWVKISGVAFAATITMPQALRIALSQSRTLADLSTTLVALKTATQAAAKKGIDVLLFPEAYLGGCKPPSR
jgi:hypothetical protein